MMLEWRDDHRWAGVIAVLHEKTNDGRVLLPSTVDPCLTEPRPLALKGEITRSVGTVRIVERTGDELVGDELVGSGTLDLEAIRQWDSGLAREFEIGEPIGVQIAVSGYEFETNEGGVMALYGPWTVHSVVIGTPVWPQAMIRMVA